MEQEAKKRGRPLKNTTVETNAEKPKNESYECNSFSYFQDVTTNLFGCNFFNRYSPEMISNLIADPIANNEELRKLSRQIYNQNGIVTNTIDYMISLPTLDHVLVCHSKSKNKATANKELMRQALKTIKDKEFIRDALYKGMIDGTAFYYCETTASVVDKTKTMSDWEIENITEINSLDFNISIVSLPTDRCRIRGIKNSSYVVAFDLTYFTDCTGESIEKKLKKYPKEIRDGFANFQNNPEANNWLILDNSKTIVHKIRSARDEKWGRPLVLAAIADILYSDYFIETKRNVLNEVNNRIYYQTFPEGKEKGSSALTQKQQVDQHNAVKSAITQKNNRGGLSFVSVAAGTKLADLPVDVSIFDEKNEKNLRDDISTDLGFGASLLNGSSSGNYSTQQNNLELISSELFIWLEGLTYEINKVINSNIIKDKKNEVEVYYLPCTFVNRDGFFDKMKDLYCNAKGSLSLLIAAAGVNVEAYMATLEYEKEMGYEDKFPIHKTSYTISDSADKSNPEDNIGGRPANNTPTNKNTVQSKTNNGSDPPKPSTK